MPRHIHSVRRSSHFQAGSPSTTSRVTTASRRRYRGTTPHQSLAPPADRPNSSARALRQPPVVSNADRARTKHHPVRRPTQPARQRHPGPPRRPPWPHNHIGPAASEDPVRRPGRVSIPTSARDPAPTPTRDHRRSFPDTGDCHERNTPGRISRTGAIGPPDRTPHRSTCRSTPGSTSRRWHLSTSEDAALTLACSPAQRALTASRGGGAGPR